MKSGREENFLALPLGVLGALVVKIRRLRRGLALACLLAAPLARADEPLADILLDVTGLSSGTEEVARAEAGDQTVTSPRYKSIQVETKTYSGAYTPTERVKLAIFSDDGCDITLDGQKIHSRFNQGQALPETSQSFTVLPGTLEPGTSYTIKVDFSNIIFSNDPNSPAYPDIDGVTLFVFKEAAAPPLQPPAAPTNLQSTVNPDGSITLTWEDNSDNEDDFVIERQRPDGTWEDIAVVPANATTYTIPAPAP